MQRGTRADVAVHGSTIGAIGPGLCVLLAVTHDDDAERARRMAEKLWHLRILADDAGVMNRSASETGAPILVVSQFTLYGDTARGRRPSWVGAPPPGGAGRRGPPPPARSRPSRSSRPSSTSSGPWVPASPRAASVPTCS